MADNLDEVTFPIPDSIENYYAQKFHSKSFGRP